MKRFLSFVLCLAMVFSAFVEAVPVTAAEAGGGSVSILREGEAVSEVTISREEKTALTAVSAGAGEYQWQIQLSPENDLWADIYDRTDSRCEVSYPLVKNMLDASGSAYIRCAVTDEGERVYSAPVCITVLPEEQSAPEAAEEPVLLDGLKLLMPATEGVEESVGGDVWQGGLAPETEKAPAEIAPPAAEEEESREEEALSGDILQPAEAFALPVPAAEELMALPVPEEEEALPAEEDFAPVLDGDTVNSEAGEETEYVTITIRYYDYLSAFPTEPTETPVDKEVYSPYVATLPDGAAFTQTVVSPTYLGFAPYYDGDGDGSIDDDASQIQLNYAEGALTENVYFDVYYKAIPVPYGIRYFFQNVTDDLYSENIGLYRTDKAETGTIVSDDKLAPTAESLAQVGMDLKGFEKLYHYPTAVAADGSTVFECYYDRNYYLIQFDLDGGYGVDPIYARYDAAIAVNDPTRHGYNFAGWKLTGIDTDHDGDWELPPADMNVNGMVGNIPAYDCLFTAQWQTVETTYTVVYWRENADDNGYSYWGSKQRNAMSATTVDGGNTAAADGMTDTQYFTYNDALTDKNVIVEGDGSTVVNVYYTRNFYTILFSAYGTCAIEANHVHGDACYDYICSYAAHVHNASCGESVLSCGLAEHKSHTAACITCGKTEHSHSDECCTAPHVHTTDCYESTNSWDDWIGNAVASNSNHLVGAPTDPVDGRVYKRGNGYNRLIYISGTWYRYNRNNIGSGTVVDPNSNCTGKHDHASGGCVCKDDLETHAHTAACYRDTLHTHTDACYTYPNCSLPAHTHTDACKRLKCGMPEGHTHSNSCNNSGRTNTVKIVYRKYQQDISDLWPVTDDNGVTYDDGQRWAPSESSYYSQVLVYLSSMPGDDFTLSLSESDADPFVMHYMLEALPGETAGTQNYSYNNETKAFYTVQYPAVRGKSFKVSANYNYVTKSEDFFDIKGFEQWTSDPTFGYNGQLDIDGGGDVYFYYERQNYKLEFNNNGVLLPDKAKDVLYEEPLKDYYFEPDYPDNLEPGAYEFKGWYNSPGCYDGSEVDWDSDTMPAESVCLYAKWAPVTHTVNFFPTLEAMEAYEAASDSKPAPYAVRTAEHGQIITQQVDDPTRTDEDGNALVFAGWFYIQNGAEKAYTPLSMPVNRDLNVYAKWSSHIPQPYRISYVLKGTDTKVADDTYGFAYNGTTRTFSAKAGDPYNQLYAGYNEGYFPTVGSHSITMAVERDVNEDGKVYYDDVVQNFFTFEYVQANEIAYRVEYRDATTGDVLLPADENTTNKAVVTERFVPIEDYTPDAIYKKLVLEVQYDEEKGEYVGTENNVIVFYYSKANVGRVAVHHNVEELTDGQYTEYAYEEVTGNNGNTIYVDSLKIPGFALSDVKPAYYELRDKQGNVTVHSPSRQEEGGIIRYPVPVNEFGTELYIYYDRLSYPYVVHYYEYNTIKSLVEDKPGTAPFGAGVTEEAVKIEGYTCVSQISQTITVRQETDTNMDGAVDEKDTVVNNVITFYYSPAKYTVKYVNTTPEGGELSQSQEIVTGNLEFAGSVPTAGRYYEFGGWFMDEACTVPVPVDMATRDPDTNRLAPVKAELDDTSDNVFYAKFDRLTGPLTVDRTSTDDPQRVFVYEIRDNQTGAVITVTVVGGGETTIPDMPLGDYTVTQKNDWSWRHSDNATTKEHNNTAGTTYAFGGGASGKWLDGVSELHKNVKGG